MTGLVRHWICDGDLTTAGGTVKAKKLGESILGKDVAHEGDPIECPTCKSTGHIKCVPPIRPAKGMDGRQKSAEGDLCICKCPTPPRLMASQTLSKAAFNTAEIASNPAAVDWFVRAGHSVASIGLVANQRFLIADENTGEPQVGVSYVLECNGRQMEGVTDAEGMTQAIHFTKENEPVTVYLKVDAT